jgi:hypothetical protein
MIQRYVKIGLLTAVLGLGGLATRVWTAETTPKPADSQDRATTRQTIHDMPLLERPNRPGHFYGNTVRRMNERRASGEK